MYHIWYVTFWDLWLRHAEYKARGPESAQQKLDNLKRCRSAAELKQNIVSSKALSFEQVKKGCFLFLGMCWAWDVETEKAERVVQKFPCICARVCVSFEFLGKRFIASMHTHACTHTSHTHGKQQCRDPSMSTSQAQPSIHFSQWPRNEWHDKQKPPHQVYKFYHRSESV